jgi:hypothetical protein
MYLASMANRVTNLDASRGVGRLRMCGEETVDESSVFYRYDGRVAGRA